MPSVKSRTYTQPPTRSWLFRTFALVLLLATLSTSAGATIFGISTARLSYDIVSVKNQPADIDNLDLVMSGDDLPVALIAKTAPIPKNGLAGLLYDMGYACQSSIDPNSTLPTPELYGLDKIALIRRGGPTENTSCTFRQKLLNAMSDGAIAAIIYNGQGQSAISGATAALYPSDLPLDILGLIVPYEVGSMLKAYLRQSTDPSNQGYYDRVRIVVTPDQRMPVIWEFVLIVVVVLLGVSFTVSVILHCRLYALRQRYRAEALARGGDLLPNGVIRMRKTIDKATLDEFPVRIIGKLTVATPSTSATITGTSMGSTSTLHLSELSVKRGASDSSPRLHRPQSGGHFESVEMSTHSRPGSISGRSIRSVKALEAAETLDASTNAVPQEGFTNDMCAICLDEFSDGEEVRTLPCHHEFHCECIDPWLLRKSSTCPLCKYECMKPATDVVGDTTAYAQTDNSLPNDRLMEFIMGREWVASRTQNGHNGTSALDRVGQFFTDTFNRIRGRSTQQQSELGAAEQGRIDDNGEVPLQSMTPRGSVVGEHTSNQVAVDEPIVIVSTPPPPPLDEVRPLSRR
ncbi:hypothetical protein BGZ95_009482 [Linnemannia exigua]|uniref:RING-type E3 ubiquitin transferase n=1 Tax=Linnemannia exigua TaxID=604196 RepID=A0AAD4H728_9FUNG|nr:hypothetical protein BGZ95_009482 [Linnemannia exigua]